MLEYGRNSLCLVCHFESLHLFRCFQINNLGFVYLDARDLYIQSQSYIWMTGWAEWDDCFLCIL